MKRRERRLSALALGSVLLFGGTLAAADLARRPARESASFGVLAAPAPEVARAQAHAWLVQALQGQPGPAAEKAFALAWDTDRPLLDRVADTLALGSPEAARLLALARDPHTPAPTTVPALLKDHKVSPYLRANLALAYARALSGRHVYEEALEALGCTRAEEVVDPAAYLFHKAVAEHALLLRQRADESIDRLLVDVPEAPERYRVVAALMHFDMLTWKEKDLGWVARKMGVIKDRLDLTRGGKKTRKMQKEVVVRLDEMIKEMENQAKSGGS
jgi:hypothetical protein